MAIEVGYGPGQMPYAAVMPQRGNRYVYDKEGGRYQVPTDFQGGEFQGQEFTFRNDAPDLSRPVDTGDEKGIQPISQPQPTLTDPSQFAQAQVGAAVRQPTLPQGCLLYTSPSPRDGLLSRMPSSA